MVEFDPIYLPNSAELPDSDDIPVDNEDQNFIPNLLDGILRLFWQDRSDWFFGVDMGIYQTTGINPRIPVVPDGFLSLGVERRKKGLSRPSYVVWEENEIIPVLVLEIVSQTYGGEYDRKMEIYAKLGVPYYLVYNRDYWQRDRHTPFEMYRLVKGNYQLQIGEPFWLEEVGLGIGRGTYQLGVDRREILSWYDQGGKCYLTPEETAQQTQQQLEELSQLLEQYRQRFGELSESSE